QLTDLAGAEAIDKLDTEFISERNAIANSVGSGNDTKAAAAPVFVNPLAQPEQGADSKKIASPSNGPM
ncbi:MAG: hypothetical protein K2X81_06965, partial [Candidatus Obscuribacterales bacterium]|nr:hypothetical protein [Candidatus Obscuribacterales bacterium]